MSSKFVKDPVKILQVQTFAIKIPAMILVGSLIS